MGVAVIGPGDYVDEDDVPEPLVVGDIVRYRHGTALYLVTGVTPDKAHLTDMGTGRDWGEVLRRPLVRVLGYADQRDLEGADQRDLEGADGRDLARARFLNYLDASKDVDDE